MKLPPLRLAARLTLLTMSLIIISQLINFAFLVESQQRLRRERFDAVISERLVQGVKLAEMSRLSGRRLARRPGLRLADGPPTDGEAEPAAERQLREALDEQGLEDRSAVVLSQTRRGGRRMLIAGVEMADGRWFHYQAPMPPNLRIPWRALMLQTGFLVVLLLIPGIWIGRRVAMPLRDLTAAADGFLTGKPSPPLPQKGPPDVRALSSAFAALEERILAALEERSMMIGAIGHDLRTPLSSLRIRVESVDDDKLRHEMIASIDDLSATLEDILQFSQGTRRDAMADVRTDAILRHLAAGYPEGTFMLTAPQVFSVHCSFEAVVRALRNLIDNARRHGAPADASSDTSAPLVELQVQAEGDSVVFIVLDRGPGIPESLLESMQQPFRRSDASRNRASGGAGLGLAIARAVAEAHDGSLQLANREGGGLRAVLRLPLGTFYSSR